MTSKQLIADCKLWYSRLLNNDRPCPSTCNELDRAFYFFSQADKNDPEIRVYHILSSFMMSVGYFDQIIEGIKNEPIMKKKDFQLIVIIACIEDLIVGGIHDDMLDILSSINETSPSRQSVIEILKAWRYEFTDKSKHREFLERAFQLDPTIPQAAIQLGRYLINNDFTSRGKELLEIGLSNIKETFPDSQKLPRWLDPEDFIDCYIRAYYCPESEYQKCQAELLR